MKKESQLVRITVDHRHGAIRWWGHAREQIPPTAAGIAHELVDGFDLPDYVVVTPAEAEAFLAWAASLPGWSAKPLVVQEIHYSRRDVRRGHRALYDEGPSGRTLNDLGVRVAEALELEVERDPQGNAFVRPAGGRGR